MKEWLTAIAENVIGEFVAILIAAAIGYLISEWKNGNLRFGKKAIRYTSSPDHKKVAIEKNGEIYVRGQAGIKNTTNHPAMDEFPEWSPNSKWYAFLSRREGIWQVWVNEPDTNRLARLTYGMDGARPFGWGPDGSLVVKVGGSYLTIPQSEIEKRLSV